MEQKLYSVEVMKGEKYYVIAFSKEHAIVEVVKMFRDSKIEDNPTDYSLKDVKEVSLSEAEDIIIDYNYLTDSVVKESLYEYFIETVELSTDIYGVVCDDFILY